MVGHIDINEVKLMRRFVVPSSPTEAAESLRLDPRPPSPKPRTESGEGT
jgi:hypothetical protein